VQHEVEKMESRYRGKKRRVQVVQNHVVRKGALKTCTKNTGHMQKRSRETPEETP
jgi:hypothetical protein